MSSLFRTERQLRQAFLVFGLVLLASMGLAFYKDQYYFLALPLFFIGGLVVLTDYRWLYYLLLVALPFSLEINLPGGFSLFFPTEPLMLVLAACGLGSWLQGSFAGIGFPARHPLGLLLFLFIGWAIFSTLFSIDYLKSVKYLIAQTLYLAVFFGLTFVLLRGPADIRRIWYWYLLALAAVLVLVLGRHLLMGFSFAKVNQAVSPFFLNHVVYAVVSGLSLPFALYLVQYHKRQLTGLLWLAVAGVIVLAIVFSYTRATWLALPATGIYYLILKKGWLRPTLVVILLTLGSGFMYLSQHNRYLVYAPEYEKTIFNKGNLEKHLEATYKLEDVSGMERLYRWIAAIRMGADKPFTGSGPSTFYPVYKKYTVKSFETFVSDNPEKSTAHNTFLLQLAEQGVIGFLILTSLICFVLVWPQTLYHRTQNQDHRALILATGTSLFIVIFHLLLNELLGLDKIGAFFFIGMAMLLRLEGWMQQEERETVSSKQ
jgi:O-antigen ligase